MAKMKKKYDKETRNVLDSSKIATPDRLSPST